MAQGGRTDYPDDFCWKIFDDFSNQIFIKVQASPGLLRKLVEAKLLHNPMEKEKLLRIFEKCPVIGCKALMTCMRAFLRKGRDPKVAFENSLSIFDRCEELKEISARMKAKARAHNAEKISQRPEDDRSAKEVQGTDDGIPDKIKYLNFFRELLNKTNKSEAQIAVALNKRDKIEVVRIERGHQEDDFHALGRCIALSSCTWRCRFTLRSLNVQHVRMFVSGLSDLPKSLKGNPCLEYIGFSLNEIGSEGFGALMNMPESVRRTISELFLKGIMADKNALVKGVLRKVAGLEKLERFDFQGNRFEEGEQEPLIHVLCQLGNLQEVSLSSLSCDECSMLLKSPPPQLNAIRLFELSSAAVETALASCKTLQRVMICESEITKEVIKRSLKISLPSCNCLESLKLINCGIDSETACSIIEAAKTCTTLQLLDLSNNVIRSTTEMCRLLQGSSFTDLNLYHNNFNESSIGEFLALSSCQQQQIPKIHLSMEWKDYAEGKLSNKKRIVFEEMFETNY